LVLPKGSVVIDPWRFVSVNEGVRLVQVGRNGLTQRGELERALPSASAQALEGAAV